MPGAAMAERRGTFAASSCRGARVEGGEKVGVIKFVILQGEKEEDAGGQKEKRKAL